MQFAVVHFDNSELIEIICEALIEIIQACDRDSPLFLHVRRYMEPTGEGTQWALQKASAAHMSNAPVQDAIMWVLGVTQSCAATVHHMEQHAGSHTLQVAGASTLGRIYGDGTELSDTDRSVRVHAIVISIQATQRFPNNWELLENTCYLLSVAIHPCAKLKSQNENQIKIKNQNQK